MFLSIKRMVSALLLLGLIFSLCACFFENENSSQAEQSASSEAVSVPEYSFDYSSVVFSEVNENVNVVSGSDLRSDPDIYAVIVSHLNSDMELLRTGVGDNGWDRLQLDGGTVVYTQSENIKVPDSTGEKVYATEKLNIRSAPSTDSVIVTTVEGGTELTRIEKGENGWDTILLDGQTVYAYSQYLTKNDPNNFTIPYVNIADTVLEDDSFSSGEVFTINNSSFVPSETLANKLKKYINGYSRDMGFYLVDLESGMTVGHNGDRQYYAASTVKAPYCLYVYKLIEQNKASLSDVLTYERRHYNSGTGIIKGSSYGTDYTLETLLYNMLTYSDNIAYYMCLEKYGIDGYNEMLASYGCKNSISDSSRWGNLTPRDAGIVWREIYRYIRDGSHGKTFFKTMKESQHPIIGRELSEYTVAHKYGWSESYYDDIAIVCGERTYVLAVFTKSAGYEENRAYIGGLARILDDLIKEYNTFIKG